MERQADVLDIELSGQADVPDMEQPEQANVPEEQASVPDIVLSAQVSVPDMKQSEHLNAAYEGEIDKVIEEMLRQSRDNYAQIEALALECSAALTSAKAKASGISEQSVFRRLWNAVTGKNERLRTAIEEDRAAAQYAMQQAINSVLRECTQNRLLALAVKSKLENELIVQQAPGAEIPADDTEEEILWTAEESEETVEPAWTQDGIQ